VNATFRIAFGNYELSLDRKALTYSLTETVTNTSWATDLSVGWIELKALETEQIVRHAFGDCKIISVSEKMSGTGKRILLGLDTPEGVPVDIYFTCAEKEIQLTVEASRDTKTHELYRICLLPGLCSAPDDGASHYVLPICDGVIIFPSEIADRSDNFSLWNWIRGGLTMPFMGAVRESSALVLITDSVYASVQLSQSSCDWEYSRDPERRRLEIRLALIPQGNHVAIAQAYREKLVNERAHITLRKKIRERPNLQKIISSSYDPSKKCEDFFEDISKKTQNRWEIIEKFSEWLQEQKEIRCMVWRGDWVAPFIDARYVDFFSRFHRRVPLASVVHRDSVAPLISLSLDDEMFPFKDKYLRSLISMERPTNSENAWVIDELREALQKTIKKEKILMNLYDMTFAAFLKEHRFLTSDFLVEEAVYTDKTYIIANFSKESSYETEEFLLPPLGFFVKHSQLTAHDALRVGDEEFATRAWRVRREGETDWTEL
jgi:hypothetical protein